MPHQRARFAAPLIKKLASLWPIVGVLGLRQVGKSTLLRDQSAVQNYFTLDDEDTLDDSGASAKSFLAKLPTPCIIDEVQKVPALFDALKAKVDRKKIPGQYYITGSSAFSSKLGIRESLTGRIGSVRLFPLTLAEAHQKNFDPTDVFKRNLKPRFSITDFSATMNKGGLPFPVFLRDDQARKLFWEGWIDTTLYRDVARVFGKNYQPERAARILDQFGKILAQGDFPSDRHFDFTPRQLRPYLEAFEAVFLVRKLICHEKGAGNNVWVLGDSGLCAHVMKKTMGSEVSLSIIRHYLFNEISAYFEYQGHRYLPVHYRTTKGSEVDFIVDGIPLKVTQNSSRNYGWEMRALEGALKKTGAKRAFLIAPVERADIPKKDGIGILPWTWWS